MQIPAWMCTHVIAQQGVLTAVNSGFIIPWKPQMIISSQKKRCPCAALACYTFNVWHFFCSVCADKSLYSMDYHLWAGATETLQTHSSHTLCETSVILNSQLRCGVILTTLTGALCKNLHKPHLHVMCMLWARQDNSFLHVVILLRDDVTFLSRPLSLTFA